MNPYVSAYIPLVDFLADCMGGNTEVVLHDLTDYHQSIVAIRNGQISGREVGSPITDLSLRVMKTALFERDRYLTNYQSVGINGHHLKSSTYFIKDDKERLVGMLCINTDYHNLIQARELLNEALGQLKVPNESAGVSESLNLNVRDLVATNIARICPDFEHLVEGMQQKEKMELVDKLNEAGTFLIKGAVVYVAELLRVSVPTVYRYLSQLKRE